MTADEGLRAWLEGPRLGRVLMAVAALGAFAGVFATVVGLTFIGAADDALTASAELTADTVEALDASVTVAGASVEALAGSLDDLARTTEALGTSLESAETLLASTADLTRNDVADSLESVERSLPALIDVAATVDTTLSALSLLPFGPDYSPDEPFDASLRRLADGLTGLPQRLREQADLVDAAAGDLSDVGAGIAGLFDDLAGLERQLAEAQGVLTDYEATAAQAQEIVAQTAPRLRRQAVFARVAVVLLGLTFTASQLVPWHLGGELQRRPRSRPDPLP